MSGTMKLLILSMKKPTSIRTSKRFINDPMLSIIPDILFLL